MTCARATSWCSPTRRPTTSAADRTTPTWSSGSSRWAGRPSTRLATRSTSTAASWPRTTCPRTTRSARRSPRPAPGRRTGSRPATSTGWATPGRSPATAATGARSRAARWSARPSCSGGAATTRTSTAFNGPLTVARGVVLRARGLIGGAGLVGGVPGVVAAARGVDVPGVAVGPVHQLPDGDEQRGAHRGQLVVHPRRDDRVHGPGHQPVALQPAQRHGQHPPGDPVDAPAQLAEPLAALAELVDDEHRPLVPDPVQYVAGPAVGERRARDLVTCPRCVTRTGYRHVTKIHAFGEKFKIQSKNLTFQI